MHITIIQGAFLPVPPIQGGAVEKIWYRMGKEFAEMGHEVVHIGRSHPSLPDVEQIAGVLYKRISGYNTPSSLFKLKTLDFLYSVKALRLINTNTDIIVTNTFWAPLLLRGKNSKKVYVDVQRVPKGQMKFYLHASILRGCSPAICDAIKKELPRRWHNIISYVPNPVPFDIKSLQINRENIILFVGRLHPEKGLHILLNAFSMLENNYSKNWRVIIVGSADFKDGGGGNEYLQKLLSLKGNNDVEFTGPIYNDDVLIKYYAQASIFCYPAQKGSGDAAPVAPREAMAYGCVPIVSKLDCFNDFIINGKNGLAYDHNTPDQVYQLSQGLGYLMSDMLRLKTLSEEAKLVSEKFSAKTIAKEFMKDFEKISFAKNKNLSASIRL